MELTQYEFIQELAKDYNFELKQKHIYPFNQFPIVNGKRKISSRYDATIVDNNGNEYPYMCKDNPNQRNNEKLIDFNHLYVIRSKSLIQILQELNLNLKTQRCKICEGNGWYTIGTRYFYKDFTCEI